MNPEYDYLFKARAPWVRQKLPGSPDHPPLTTHLKSLPAPSPPAAAPHWRQRRGEVLPAAAVRGAWEGGAMLAWTSPAALLAAGGARPPARPGRSDAGVLTWPPGCLQDDTYTESYISTTGMECEV